MSDNEYLINTFDINNVNIPTLNIEKTLIFNGFLKQYNIKNMQIILTLYPYLLFNSILLKDKYYDSVFNYKDNFIYITNYYKYIENKNKIDSDNNYLLIFCDNILNKIERKTNLFTKIIKIDTWKISEQFEQLLNKTQYELYFKLREYNLNVNNEILKLQLLTENLEINYLEIKNIMRIIKDKYIYDFKLKHLFNIRNYDLIQFVKNMSKYYTNTLFDVRNNNYYIEQNLLLYLTVLDHIL